MSTESAIHVQQQSRADLSVDLFRFLERKLRAMRSFVMRHASQTAAKESSSPAYRVSEEHIDRALKEILDEESEVETLKYLLDLPYKPGRKPPTIPPTAKLGDRTEDFPFVVFRHLERKLQILRGAILQKAAKLAEECEEGEESGASVRRLSELHIKRALSDILDHPNGIREMIGVVRD